MSLPIVVVSGCGVTYAADLAHPLRYNIASGVLLVAGAEVTYAGGTVDLTGAGTFDEDPVIHEPLGTFGPRFDWVYLSNVAAVAVKSSYEHTRFHNTSARCYLARTNAQGLIPLVPFNLPEQLEDMRVFSQDATVAVVASSGWGASKTVTKAKGNKLAGEVLITAAGGSYGASPTVAITFTNPGWQREPIAIVTRNGGAHLDIANTWAWGKSGEDWTLTITYGGTPDANAYTLTYRVTSVD